MRSGSAKKLSLQWRITLTTALLVCVTCVLISCLIGYSGMRYMESIGNSLAAYSDIDKGEPDSFDPESVGPEGQNLGQKRVDEPCLRKHQVHADVGNLLR